MASRRRSPRSSVDRALASGARSTGSSPVGGTKRISASRRGGAGAEERAKREALRKKPRLSLAAAFRIYLLDMEARRYAPGTLGVARAYIGPFVQLRPEAELSSLGSAEVREYLAGRAPAVAPTTLHSIARSLRAFCNFCVREGWLEASPMASVRMPRKPKIIKSPLSEAQAARLLRLALSPRDRAILLLLLDTGLRASELCGLRRRDVDLAGRRLFVNQGKGSRDREVYIGARSAKALVAHLAREEEAGPETPLFVGERGRGPLTASGLYRLVLRLGERAGVEGATPHQLRRTFAVLSLRAGMDIFALQAIMGHEDLETLRLYVKLAKEDVAREHALHGPADRV